MIKKNVEESNSDNLFCEKFETKKISGNVFLEKWEYVKKNVNYSSLKNIIFNF